MHRPARRTAARRSRFAADRCPGTRRRGHGRNAAQRAAHVVMVAQQIARGENQIVEIELGAARACGRDSVARTGALRRSASARTGWPGLPEEARPRRRSRRCSGTRRRRSADRRRPWRGRAALPRRPICPSCGRRRKLPALVQRSGWGREVSSRTRPAGVADRSTASGRHLGQSARSDRRRFPARSPRSRA